MTTLYRLDEGVKIVLDCVVDISGATKRRIGWKAKGPNESDYIHAGCWIAEEEDNTHISYTVTDEEILNIGTWVLQAYVEKGAWKYSGAQVQMVVASTRGCPA